MQTETTGHAKKQKTYSQKSREKNQGKQNHRQPRCWIQYVTTSKINITNIFKNLQEKLDKMGVEMKNFRGDKSSTKGLNGNPRTKNYSIEIKN